MLSFISTPYCQLLKKLSSCSFSKLNVGYQAMGSVHVDVGDILDVKMLRVIQYIWEL